MTPCKKCGATTRTKSGHCLFCRIVYDAQRYIAKQAEIKAQVALYRKANLEKVRLSSAKAHRANPTVHKRATAKYRHTHAEKCCAATKVCRKANPAKYNSYVRKRQASKLNAAPEWANDFFIAEIYDLAVRRTRTTKIKWHVDHIVPLQSKLVCGLHVHTNLQVLTAVANRVKGNRAWPDMP